MAAKNRLHPNYFICYFRHRCNKTPIATNIPKNPADNISYGFKAERNKQNLQHYTGGKWEDWTIKGVNLGMAKPGAFQVMLQLQKQNIKMVETN